MPKFNNPYIEGGDAFVLLYNDKYYLYCTGDTENSYDTYVNGQGWQTNKGERDGLEVHVSDDMQTWTNLGYCLEKGKGAIGSQMFWAPEVYRYNNKFYMAYVADEHCCIAVADKPEGPFVQKNLEYLINEPSIDPHLFFDDDGRVYLYYVDVTCGNRIFVTEMKEDLSCLKTDKKILLIEAQNNTWENLNNAYPVAEGPFVLKHNGLYYLSYSCNNVIDPHYGVGYAVSSSPWGPFERYEGNPILIGKGELCGFGHHSFVYDKDGDLICVHHCHNPHGEKLAPRKICFRKAEFKKNSNGGNDILQIENDE